MRYFVSKACTLIVRTVSRVWAERWDLGWRLFLVSLHNATFVLLRSFTSEASRSVLIREFVNEHRNTVTVGAMPRALWCVATLSALKHLFAQRVAWRAIQQQAAERTRSRKAAPKCLSLLDVRASWVLPNQTKQMSNKSLVGMFVFAHRITEEFPRRKP